MAASLTGYGPSKNIYFNGDEGNYELWEVKFLAYLRLHKLHSVVIDAEGSFIPDQAGSDVADKNAEVFAALVQLLDDKSLNLIIRDAKNDGRKSLKILREHYMGCSKPRIISMYCELTSLKLVSNESVTEYLLRGETTVTRLKEAGEKVSDALLIAMILKGLPESFKSFSTVIIQSDVDTMSFKKFKTALRNYEENEKARSEHLGSQDDSVMKMFNKYPVVNKTPDGGITCFKCGQKGHKSFQCRQRSTKFCDFCKTNSHDTKACRKKRSAATKSMQDKNNSDDSSYIFKVCIDNAAVNIVNDMNSSKLLVDCGATAHIICDKSKFIHFDENFCAENHVIELADSSRKQGIVTGKGSAKVKLTDDSGNVCDVILEGALCVPTYKQDILSVQCMTKKGVNVNFGPKKAEIVTPDGKKFNINQNGKLYYVNMMRSSVPKSRSLQQWHEILGHCNVKDILKLENVVSGMKISDRKKFDCATCVEGKMVQYRSHAPDEKAKKPLDLVHSDLAGPISPSSREGSKYAMVFTDDFSGIIFVYFLKNKSDAVHATSRFLADVAPHGIVKSIRSDNGSEYACNDFKKLMIDNKIRHEFSAPYSQWQNGTAERSWRTLFDMGRCLLIQNNMPKFLWNHAVRTAAYIRNRCHVPRLNCTPYEKFTSSKPNVGNMHIFGSTCFAYIQDKKKLDPRAEQGQFVGYDFCSPAFLIYFSSRNEIRRVRCVEFFDQIPDINQDHVPEIPQLVPEEEAGEQDEENEVDNSGITEKKILAAKSTIKKTEPAATENVSRQSSRVKKAPKYLGDYVTSGDSSSEEFVDTTNVTIDYFYKVSVDIPITYHDAIVSKDCNKWQAAMNDEIASLIENDTYDLCNRPNRPIIGGRWVYSKKCSNENPEIFKARFVAKGFAQIPGIDYHETFSPTARLSSIRVLANVAVHENLVVHQMDVKCAFLNAKLDCEVYIEQPEGFKKVGKNGENLVYRLKKSLYGLKQSGRLWNNLLHSFLVDQNFVRSEAENCVYIRCENGTKIIIIIWVDDLIIAGSSLKAVEEMKVSLSNKFKMKDFGQISNFLGIQFDFKLGSIVMHQAKYAEKILSRFHMLDCNPKSVPCEPNIVKIDGSNSEIFENNRLYREIVGSLVYLMSCTRPDLSYVVTKLSEKLEYPTIAHFNLCKFVLKYIKGTIDQGLIFKQNNDALKLIGYSDSDWGSSSDRKSITGYCYRLFDDCSFISWKTRKQPTVALSTCEAEYMAVTHAVQEGIFLRQLLLDLRYPDMTINLFVDNKGAIDLSNNPVHHNRSKHIDIRYHFVRNYVQDGTVSICHVPSQDNYADYFTKPISKYNIRKLMIN